MHPHLLGQAGSTPLDLFKVRLFIFPWDPCFHSLLGQAGLTPLDLFKVCQFIFLGILASTPF